MKGKNHSEESINKMREARKNRPEWNAKIAAALTGRKLPPEVIAKQKDARAKTTAKNKEEQGRLIFLHNPEGELIEVTHLEEFCKENDLSYEKILEVLKNRAGGDYRGWSHPFPRRGKKGRISS